MLNNKATQEKLESLNYLATQTKQCDWQDYSNQLVTEGGYFYATQAKKTTSKLLKLN